MKAPHRILDPNKPSDTQQGQCALAVMTKMPRAGRVKTRLSPPLTPQEAAALNTCFLRDIAAAIASLARTAETRGIAVYTPVGAEEEYAELLPGEFELVTQRGNELGERLTFASEDLFALGFKSFCLINSDSPTVPPPAFSQAAQILLTQEADVVLGPSDDGGYYLIGLNKLNPSLFENIPWSTDRVLDQTRARAQELGLKVHLLQTWYDVDNGATLRRLCRELFAADNLAPGASCAPATRAYLNTLLRGAGRARIWPDEAL